MGILNYFQFDDVKSSDYGIYISGEALFNAPKRSVENISIPGRDGDLVLDLKRFENIEVPYPAFNFEDGLKDFREKLAGLRSALGSKVGYQRLTDTFHPDEFRMGVYKEGLEVKPIMYNEAANFDIKFDCKPQRFLVSGEIPHVFNSNGTIENPTLFASSPLIKVTGNGTVAFGNNGEYRFIVSDNSGTIWIDTDIMEAYLPAGDLYPWTDENGQQLDQELGIGLELLNGTEYPTNMLGHIEFIDSVMPKIDPGEQPVRMSPTITELEIIPRWWRL